MRRIEIEGQGIFSVPAPVYGMVLELIARAEAAEADRDRAWLAYQTADGVAGARWDEMQKLFARLEALEAENVRLCRERDGWMKASDVANAEVARLREALADIAAMTDADDPQSYRCDDREGCLDTVYAKATRMAL